MSSRGELGGLLRTSRQLEPILSSLCVLASFGMLACFEPDDGREPPLDRLYFPSALALSPDGERLYVANSDWDLQFNAGSVQVYDAARLRETLPRHCEGDADCANGERCDVEPSVDESGVARAPTFWCVEVGSTDPCGGLSLQSAAERATSPGLCSPLDNRDPSLLLGSVRVGAFATDLIYRQNPAGGGRLFVPVRSDATLHWIDVAGDAPGTRPEIDCGQDAAGECDERHRTGDAPEEASPSGEELPIEPFGIDATADGTAIVVSHQTEGRVSLFINDWNDPEAGPRLSYVLEGLPLRPVVVSAIPVPEVARLDRLSTERTLGYRPGFWVAFRGTPFVQLIRYFDSVDAPGGAPFLQTAFADRLTATVQSDIRGVAVDASERSACESACAGARDCLVSCAGIALDVFMSNSVPSSLVVGHSSSSGQASVPNDRLQTSGVVALDDGPSRTVLGQVLNERGEPERRVFVTSFDARSVTIYDPDADVIEARVLTGRGPAALAIDNAHAVGYVAHFTDSYVGIIDLDRRNPTYGTIIRALGRPTPPRGDE